jgi:hypothetical protein
MSDFLARPYMPDYVRVDAPDFRVKDCLAYPQELREYGPGQWYLHVRLELPDGHSALQDAAADGFDPEQAEFIAIVPVRKVRLMNDVRYDKSGYFRSEVRRQEEVKHLARVRRAEQRVRERRLVLPELDAALRG